MNPPNPELYKLGETIYIPTESGTLELKCIKDAASGDKLWAFIEIVEL